MATIVVVEDQPDSLKLIKALLTLKGHRVVGLASGEELVATLRAELIRNQDQASWVFLESPRDLGNLIIGHPVGRKHHSVSADMEAQDSREFLSRQSQLRKNHNLSAPNSEPLLDPMAQ